MTFGAQISNEYAQLKVMTFGAQTEAQILSPALYIDYELERIKQRNGKN